MDSRRFWGWLLAGIVACPIEKKESAEGDSTADSAADSDAGCNDGLTKEEWVAAWNLSFCTWAVQCEWPVYGDSMARCYELTVDKVDRCLDECRTADALAAMQAHEASGSCEIAAPEASPPYCAE